jgi:hypothetical protein
VGVKKPIRGGDEVECLAVSGCNGAASRLEGQPILVIKYVQRKLGQVLQQSVIWFEVQFKQWTQPSKTSQITSTLSDLTRSKSELIAENMFLRQQLIVQERQVTRPQLKPRDRQILVVLASRIRGWKPALVIVKPEPW